MAAPGADPDSTRDVSLPRDRCAWFRLCKSTSDFEQRAPIYKTTLPPKYECLGCKQVIAEIYISGLGVVEVEETRVREREDEKVSYTNAERGGR